MSKPIQASDSKANSRQLSNAELLRKVKTAFFIPSGRNDEITLWARKESRTGHLSHARESGLGPIPNS
jgi:hypothetical protein